jgi:excisionase family DNA binding protein
MSDTLTTPAAGSQLPGGLDAATYTVEQLAAALQCSPRHVWRQIDLGAIPGVLRVGRLVRISRAIADSWIRDGAPPRRRGER